MVLVVGCINNLLEVKVVDIVIRIGGMGIWIVGDVLVLVFLFDSVCFCYLGVE